MEFTKFEATYYSVKDIQETTAYEVTDFFTLMKNNGGKHTCKEWAYLFYGETEDYLEKSNIAKVATMIRHLCDFVSVEEVEVEPFVETIPVYAYINLDTKEVVPVDIEARDAEGNVYRVYNRKVDELRKKGIFGYEEIGERTVSHRKFIKKYYVEG